MTSTLFQDPDLAEVLLDVVNDRDSTLFRVPLTTVADGMAGAKITVSARSAGLTSAERHLLDVHRAALAEQLRLAAWMVLENKPETSDRLCLDWETPDAETWAADAREELATEGVSCAGTEVDLLQRCVKDGLGGYTSAIPLAMAAQRLRDTCSAREVIALDTLHSGFYRSAERLLMEILRTPRTERQTYLALLNLAGAASEDGRLQTAATRYLKAGALCPGREEAWAPALVCALLSGNEEQALMAGLRLGDGPPRGSFAAVIRQLENRNPDSVWAPNNAARRISPSIERRAYGLTKELIHALL
jgi:hypothetical protein